MSAGASPAPGSGGDGRAQPRPGAPGAPAERGGPPDVRRRALTIAWGLPIVVGCVWLGPWILALAAAVLAVASLGEFWALGRPFGVPAGRRWEVVGAALLLLAGAALGPAHFAGALALGIAATVTGGVVRAAASRGAGDLREALAGTLWAMLALLYIPWLLGYVVLLRHTGAGGLGLRRALCAIGFVWVGDVAAFLVGGRFGRHRLAARISPGKTVEGALVAIAAAAGAGAASAGLLGLPVWAGAVVAGAIGGAGLVGDLWESLLKRGAEVKDSGGGVPGHGGVLDRFDSLLLAAPLAYWLLARVPWSHLAILR